MNVIYCYQTIVNEISLIHCYCDTHDALCKNKYTRGTFILIKRMHVWRFIQTVVNIMKLVCIAKLIAC